MICARTLTDRGYSVTVFEKEKTPGGRLAALRLNGIEFDHGCPYFYSQNKMLKEQVDDWIVKDAVRVWPARRVSFLQGDMHNVEDDQPLYVGIPDMDQIARHLGAGLDVRIDTIVSSVKRTQDRWQLMAGGKREMFDIVVSAIPAEQTAELFKKVPSISEEAVKVRTQPVWSVTAGFDKTLNVDFDIAHFSSRPVILATNSRSKPGRSRDECWVLQASTEWSEENVSTPPDEVAHNLLAVFFDEIGLQAIPAKHLHAHRWYYGTPQEPLYKDFLWDDRVTAGACGDWCHNGRFEGAFISGLRMAQTIMEKYPQ